MCKPTTQTYMYLDYLYMYSITEDNLHSVYSLHFPNKCFFQIWICKNLLVAKSLSWLSKSYPLMTFLHQGDKHGTELEEEKCVKSLKADFLNSSSKYFALLKMLLTCSHRSKGLCRCLGWNFISAVGKRSEPKTSSRVPDISSQETGLKSCSLHQLKCTSKTLSVELSNKSQFKS